MNFVRLLPVVLSFLLLGAHFYRAGLYPVTLLCVGLPFLLFLRRSWLPLLIQVLLTLGALEWLRALYGLVQMRIAFGEPWTRLAVILGAVSLFTLLSGLAFRLRALRAFYGVD